MQFESYSELLRRFPKMRLRGWDASVLLQYVQWGLIDTDPDRTETAFCVEDVRYCLAHYPVRTVLSTFEAEEEA